MNKTEILEKYLAEHEALGRQKDAPDKEEFDREHRQLWHTCDVELRQRRVELEQEENLTDEEQQELRELKEALE